MVETYKVVHGIEGLQERRFFTRRYNTSNTRGNSVKFYKPTVKTDIGKYNFGNRIINQWNNLPNEIVNEKDLNKFKGKLDIYMKHIRGLWQTSAFSPVWLPTLTGTDHSAPVDASS